MRKILLSMAVVAMLCACGGQNAQQENSQAQQPEPVQTAETVTADVAQTDASHGDAVKLLADKSQLEKGDKPVIVDFGATWCPPCQEFKPHFAAVAEKFASKATFIYADVDKWQEVAVEFGAQSIPTIVVIKTNGEKVSHTGYMTESEFSKFVEDNLK